MSSLKENFFSLSPALLCKLDKAGDNSGSPYSPARTFLESMRMGREKQTLTCALLGVLGSTFNKLLLIQFWPCSARMRVQRAHILPLSLHPGLAIRYALDEGAVVARVQQSCSPVRQHPWASGRLCLARGVGYGPGEHLPPSTLQSCPWSTDLANLNLQTPQPRSTWYPSLIISAKRWHRKPSGYRGLGTSEQSLRGWGMPGAL